MEFNAINEVLTVAEMYAADEAAAASGIASLDLMENAGRAVSNVILERYFGGENKRRRVLVLCGPGNNGGDGFVIARLLRQAKVPVDLALHGGKSELSGGAAVMARRWRHKVHDLAEAPYQKNTLVVDALFGAGLSRPLSGEVENLLREIASQKLTSIAVDVPSGVDGDSGAIRGYALKAAVTVTFFRKKPGHLLFPGRGHCGEILVADISIPRQVLTGIAPRTFENCPDLWLDSLPKPSETGHKYQRGHAIVVSGGLGKSGAARLGAQAALRVGAGLVTVAAPIAAVPECAAHLTAIMLEGFSKASDLDRIVSDPRRNAVLIGPGNGVNAATRRRTLGLLETDKVLVMDADALTAFEKGPKGLFDSILSRKAPVVMTPHEGEFKRLFRFTGDRLARTCQASKQSGAVVVHKGADTVIAAPDGRAAINTNAPSTLATAGAGDVLAGLVLGLVAQGMMVFEAACAAAWLHGAAATEFGPGLIAEDIPDFIPKALKKIL